MSFTVEHDGQALSTKEEVRSMSEKSIVVSGKTNIARMFRSTAIVMILSELAGVVAVLIDGITTSQFLGVDVYSGISLLRPFTSIILMVAGFLSTGCSIFCSQKVGAGKKDEANTAFNLVTLIGLAAALALFFICMLIPDGLLRICGVSLSKYPELNPYMFQYLNGYMIGVPFLMITNIISPILVMDNGKKLFTISTVALCVTDVAGDLLNVFFFRGGAFGMGLATSIAYIVQMLILIFHFIGKNRYFHFSLKAIRFRCLIYRRL